MLDYYLQTFLLLSIRCSHILIERLAAEFQLPHQILLFLRYSMPLLPILVHPRVVYSHPCSLCTQIAVGPLNREVI